MYEEKLHPDQKKEARDRRWQAALEHAEKEEEMAATAGYRSNEDRVKAKIFKYDWIFEEFNLAEVKYDIAFTLQGVQFYFHPHHILLVNNFDPYTINCFFFTALPCTKWNEADLTYQIYLSWWVILSHIILCHDKLIKEDLFFIIDYCNSFIASWRNHPRDQKCGRAALPVMVVF